jgi:hypothetical protein
MENAMSAGSEVVEVEKVELNDDRLAREGVDPDPETETEPRSGVVMSGDHRLDYE